MTYIVLRSVLEGGTIRIMTTAWTDGICKETAMWSAQQMRWMNDDEELHHGE
jgi:hypothetical protein